MATEVPHEHDPPPGATQRLARGRRDRGARSALDRGPPAPAVDLERARDARLGVDVGRGRAPASTRACGQGHQRPVRRDPERTAGDRPQGGDRGRTEAAMTLWWIGDFVLLLVVLPVVVWLLSGVLREARAIVPSIAQIRDAARAGSKDLDAAPLLLTTQDQVIKTVEGVADYGGSLDVILDDAWGRGGRHALR